MRYQYLLVDLDDTLMDYSLSERLALKETLTHFSLRADDEICDAYHEINERLWSQRIRGEITRPQLRFRRFQQLMQLLGSELSPDELNQFYTGRLMQHGEVLPGAEALLRAAHESMRIALVTNGVSETQRSRLAHSNVEQYLDVLIISEEVNLKKPDPAMVELALNRLGCIDKHSAVFLGDSLTADKEASLAAGVDFLWFNQADKQPTEAYHGPTVSTLQDAATYLGLSTSL